MKLTVPVRNIAEIDFAYKLGIRDMYAGFIDDDFEKQEKGTGIYNGRLSSNGNFPNIESIQEASLYCKNKGISFNLTFNSIPFVGNENLLKIALENIKKIHAHNIIIADISVMNFFKNDNIIISTLASLYNSSSISFFLDKYPNIKRIVLPRELSIREKISIIQDTPMHFEVLILNDWCYNSNAMCSSMHFGKIVEKVKYSCKRDDTYYSRKCKKDTKKLKKITGKRNDCKVCSMYFYKSYPELYFKIAGRTKNSIALKKDILFAKIILDRLKENENYQEFLSKNIKLHKKIFQKECDFNNCEYYKTSKLTSFSQKEEY